MSNKPKGDNKVTDQLIPENITVTALEADRLILKLIPVPKIKQSNIINPATDKPFEQENLYDRYRVRGEIMFLGEKLKETHPHLYKGGLVFVETSNALIPIMLNNEVVFLTRVSNIVLTYQENDLHLS